mgnify:CR=1 FL=1
MAQSFDSLTAAQIAAGVAAGDFTATEVAQASLAAIEAREGGVQAFLQVAPELALEAAARVDADRAAGKPLPPLAGVPLAIKDNMNLVGTRTTCASRMLENYQSVYTATCVQRMLDAGCLPMGKANMDEFAFGSSTESSAFHRTNNPWDTERVPGGSSGGSAAAVAAGEVALSLGSDTGGSIRQPAALCGCVGLKPTYGRVSRYGVIAYGSSLDQVGPLTRTVEDAALVLSVIAGHDKRDSTSSPRPVDGYADFSRSDLKGVRLGVPREFMAEGLDGPVAKACQDALARARDLGAELVDVSLPHATRHAIAAYYIVAMAEASSNLSRFDGVRYGYRAAEPKNLDDLYCRSRSEGFGQEVQRRILLGTYVLSAGYYDAYYKKAAQVRRLIRQDYLNALGSCDALFGPVSPVTAWKLGSIIDDPLKMYLMDIYTVSLNLAGLPGLSFPVGEADGLPVGMQLIGKDFDEAGILGIGNVLSK